MEGLLVQPGDRGAETVPAYTLGPSTPFLLLEGCLGSDLAPLHVPDEGPLSEVPQLPGQPCPVGSAQRPTGAPDVSCSLCPAVGSAACVAGPPWPQGRGGGHTNPWDLHSPLGAAAQAVTCCPLLPPPGQKPPCTDTSNLHLYSPPGNLVSGLLGIPSPPLGLLVSEPGVRAKP